MQDGWGRIAVPRFIFLALAATRAGTCDDTDACVCADVCGPSLLCVQADPAATAAAHIRVMQIFTSFDLLAQLERLRHAWQYEVAGGADWARGRRR